MREKRLSILVRVCFLEGRRKRGSVAKAAKRGSVIVSLGAEDLAPLAPLEVLGFTILGDVGGNGGLGIVVLVRRVESLGWELFLPGGVLPRGPKSGMDRARIRIGGRYGNII